jgi:hypothetical protein
MENNADVLSRSTQLQIHLMSHCLPPSPRL